MVNLELLTLAKKCREKFAETLWHRGSMHFTPNGVDSFCSIGLIRYVLFDGATEYLQWDDVSAKYSTVVEPEKIDLYKELVAEFDQCISGSSTRLRPGWEPEDRVLTWNDDIADNREAVEDVWERVVSRIGGVDYPDAGRTVIPSKESDQASQ